MNVLTQSERDGLDDVFLSIDAGDKQIARIKGFSLCVLSNIKYINTRSTNILHTLQNKIKAFR